jgi:hypothetical protein
MTVATMAPAHQHPNMRLDVVTMVKRVGSFRSLLFPSGVAAYQTWPIFLSSFKAAGPTLCLSFWRNETSSQRGS